MGLAAAAAFTWLGMVLAISFLEAPLKFRAPGVTVRLGLGIGRVVFAALNRVELVMLLAVVGALLLAGTRPVPVLGAAALVGVLLAAQLGLVRPVLNRRSDRVLAGEELPRSRAPLLHRARGVQGARAGAARHRSAAGAGNVAGRRTTRPGAHYGAILLFQGPQTSSMAP